MMESTQAAIRSRKSHHKSRSGCGNCKKRRIKVSDPSILCHSSTSTLLPLCTAYTMDNHGKSTLLKGLRILRSIFCLSPKQRDSTKSETLPGNLTNSCQCDETKPACVKCTNHSIECDFLTAETSSLSPASSVSQPVSSNTRFRFKPSKYQSSKRSSSVTSTRQASQEVVPRSEPAVPELPQQETLSFDDLRLFHHFVTETYRTLADQSTDRNRVWQCRIPEWGFSTPSIFHLMLAMSALHKGHLNQDQRDQYVMQADAHFTFGIRSVSAILSRLNADNCQLIYMSAVLICFVYFAHGPRPGEYLVFSQTGKAEWLVLMRGVRSILTSHHERIFSGVLEIQDDPTIQGVSPSLQDELRGHLSRIEGVQLLIQGQVGVDHCEIYSGALDNLKEMFEEAYQIYSAQKDGTCFMSVVVGWIYRRPEEFICLLEGRDPYSLVILAYWCVLLKFMGSSWMMIGWDRHVIGGIQECLASEFHPYIEWPVGVICS